MLGYKKGTISKDEVTTIKDKDGVELDPAISFAPTDSGATYYQSIAFTVPATPDEYTVYHDEGVFENRQQGKNKDGVVKTFAAAAGLNTYTEVEPFTTDEVSFNDLTANGTANSVTTTELTITLDKDVAGLAAADITVTGATKGALTKGTGTGVYKLAVSNITSEGANVMVSIIKQGFTITPTTKNVAVHKEVATPTPTAVAFNTLTANGTANSVTTTELTITLDKDVAGLAAADITVIGATKGALTKGTGTGVYKLAVSNITSEGASVTVAIAKDGFTFTPPSKTVTVHKEAGTPTPTAVAFNTLTANGTANSVTTTELTITLDKDVAGLAAADISVTGATKGALTKGTGTGVYKLAVSNITSEGASVTVAIAKDGFIISPQSKTVVVHKKAVIPPRPTAPSESEPFWPGVLRKIEAGPVTRLRQTPPGKRACPHTLWKG